MREACIMMLFTGSVFLSMKVLVIEVKKQCIYLCDPQTFSFFLGLRVSEGLLVNIRE